MELHEGLSRKERERMLRREAILDAARSVFAERGYDHATLDEVAERAEFGKGTLYNYFEDGKEELLFAILDGIFDEMVQMIEEHFSEERLEQHSFRDLMKAFAEARFGFFLEREDLFMILIKELHRLVFSDDQQESSYFHRQQNRMVDALVRPLEHGMNRGVIREAPARPIAFMILGNINGIQMHLCMHLSGDACDRSNFDSTADAAEFLTQTIIDGLGIRDLSTN